MSFVRTELWDAPKIQQASQQHNEQTSMTCDEASSVDLAPDWQEQRFCVETLDGAKF